VVWYSIKNTYFVGDRYRYTQVQPFFAAWNDGRWVGGEWSLKRRQKKAVVSFNIFQS
jgi:hypothetical protein